MHENEWMNEWLTLCWVFLGFLNSVPWPTVYSRMKNHNNDYCHLHIRGKHKDSSKETEQAPPTCRPPYLLTPSINSCLLYLPLSFLSCLGLEIRKSENPDLEVLIAIMFLQPQLILHSVNHTKNQEMLHCTLVTHITKKPYSWRSDSHWHGSMQYFLYIFIKTNLGAVNISQATPFWQVTE